MDDSLRCGYIFPWRDDARFAAAAMMASSGVDMRLVIYLCLEKPSLIFLVYMFPSPTFSSSNSVQGEFPVHRP